MSQTTETIAIELRGQGQPERSNTSIRPLRSNSPPPTDAVESLLADATVPDGGYGWVIVFASAIICFWFVGTSYSWGVIQKALVDGGLSSASTLSFVGGLTPMCIAVLAIFNARIIRAVGARWTALLGVLLLGLGEVMAGFAVKNVAALFGTIGVISGVGTSLCFIVVSTTPTQYFARRRGLANGIVYAGGGIGGAATSLAMEKLIQGTSLAWTFRIIGLLTLATGLPAAYLLKERAPTRRKTFIEWKLFRDLKFCLLFAAGAIATFPLFVPPFFLPLYAHSIGLSASAGAALVAGFNLSSAFGRIGLGLLCDLIGPLHALLLSLLLSGFSMLAIWPLSRELGPLILFVVINGAANGGFFATMPTVVGSLFGSTRVAVAMGMVVTGWAGGYLLGGPIAGYILSAFGGAEAGFKAYRPAMYYAGSMSLAAAGLVGVLRWKTDRKWKKKV
ncbi:MFS general substrate transporter [Mytilinidion resinicola]|uniref:MFS general substrate transporter n=1 Tax=Mytilinidion resinicola TaxID=574789 RepID=A0A6A6YQV0_9PEZI|nr:MFS general substrate transporter [Mytilinidion resinicola]KAF2810889.1 MFS general substrate transporter [Mytilinidion resinicola]